MARAEESYLGTGGWADVDWLTVEEKLIRWSYFVILKQRGISWAELREELGGISHQRLGQILNRLGEERYHYRIDEAVSRITERKHREAGHTDDDPDCAVYTLAEEDGRLRQAKEGVMREWRIASRKEREQEARTTDLTPTAPPQD